MWRWLVAGADASKRVFDVFASALLLLLLSPLYVLLALLVRWEDGGPAILGQTRMGRRGREFRMYKFRSLGIGAEAQLDGLLALNRHGEGVSFKIEGEPRLTRVGKWLRRSSLDELPQLWNVLRGDMSLVGPLPREVARYSLAGHRRLAVKPGLTCFWQVGGRSQIPFAEQVRLDVDYIETQTFWVDVRILIQTVPAVLSGGGACS